MKHNLKFIPYRSAQVLNPKSVEILEAVNGTDPSIKWIATEKIHGANIQIRALVADLEVVDDLIIGSREIFLKESDKFYGYKAVIKDSKDHLLYMLESILDLYDNPSEVESVIIYGEIAGDGVQKEIKYEPEKRIYVFDATIILKDGTEVPIAPDSIIRLFNESTKHHKTLRMPPILATGTYDEIVSTTPREYTSKVRPDLYTEDLYNEDGTLNKSLNIAEGYILRPAARVLFFTNKNEDGSISTLPVGTPWHETGKTYPRMIFKVKPSIWSEVKDKRFFNKDPFDPEKEFDEEELKLYNDVMPLINENRASNVMSKKANVNRKDFMNYADSLVLDAFMELYPEMHYIPNVDKLQDAIKRLNMDLGIKVSSRLKRILYKEASNYIRPIFMDRISIED